MELMKLFGNKEDFATWERSTDRSTGNVYSVLESRTHIVIVDNNSVP
jgi:hypothetical protein